jgi:rod shape-determining protein MreC
MKRLNLKFLFIFSAIFGLLVFLHNSGTLAPVEGALQFVLNPISSRLQSLSGKLNLLYRSQTRKGDLSSVIEDLESKLEQATIENSSLKKMEEENIKLRQYLGFFNDHEGFKRVMANVVARESFGRDGERGDFIIDRGSSDGVYEGLAVIDEKGAVVGKTVAVEERSARLKLSTDPECKLAAAVLRGGRTIGTTSGNLGLTVNLDFVPQAAEIARGDIIVTSGLEPNIPSGLAIGRVTLVDKGTNEIWQKVNAEPVVDFDKIFMVAVVLP